MDKLRAFFEERIEIDDSNWELFVTRLVKRTYPKNTTLLHVGTTENHLSFIEEGIVRSYIPNEGNDITFDLAFKDSFVSAYDSFMSRNPSTYRLDTLTDTTMLSITHASLQQLFHQRKIGNIIGRLACENMFGRLVQFRLDRINCTSEEIYHALRSKHGNEIAKVPKHFIASYLGITTQALGRIDTPK